PRHGKQRGRGRPGQSPGRPSLGESWWGVLLDRVGNIRADGAFLPSRASGRKRLGWTDAKADAPRNKDASREGKVALRSRKRSSSAALPGRGEAALPRDPGRRDGDGADPGLRRRRATGRAAFLPLPWESFHSAWNGVGGDFPGTRAPRFSLRNSFL